MNAASHCGELVTESGGKVRFWAAVGLSYVVCAALLVVVSAPAPFLLAGVLAGAGCTLLMRQPQPFPEPLRRVGLAIIGSAAGSAIKPDVVATVVARADVVLGGVVATLAISLVVGQLLRLSPSVDGPTAVFASIAGGASGVSAVAREMGADESIVLSVQYLRVLLILASLPVVSDLLGAEPVHGSAASDVPLNAVTLAFSGLTVVAGLVLGRFIRFSASSLVLPMVVATTVSLATAAPDATVPPAVLDVGYAAAGLMVGVAFTRSTVRRIARLMPLALLQVVLVVGGCALVGFALARVTGMTPLDGYLATTPGGLPAVTAIAIGSGASVGLVITMQLVRLFLALLMTPIVGALVRARRKPRDPQAE